MVRELVCMVAQVSIVAAQENFAGAMAGISTLSADARIEGSPPERISAYKPENGPGLTLLAGRHFADYFSMQISYVFNRNDALLTAANILAGSSFDMPAEIAMHSFMPEAMAYFRPRTSRLRPYLSAGPGIVRGTIQASGAPRIRGISPLPLARAESTSVALRVAVGADFRIGRRFHLRYTFSETIQRNALSRMLDPPGERNLANFQNWWGALWTF